MRCLEKDPNARYASGESLAASLYPFARSKAEAAPNRFDFSWWKRPLHARDKWIGLAACAITILAIPGAYNWNARRNHGNSVVSAASLSTGQIADSTSSPLEAGLPITGGPMAIANIPNLSGAYGEAPTHSRSARVQSRTKHPKQLSAGHDKGTQGDGQSVSGNATQTPAENSSRRRETSNPESAITPVHAPAEEQVALNIEIASAIDGETLAIYADQHLVATSPLSVTASGEMLHLERPLAAGPHEFRVALYRPDQSLHLERGGLAEIQSGSANLLAIKVVKHAKMFMKRDAALEILWPGAPPLNNSKPAETLADASASPPNNK
jgi:hypothetical protein